MEVCDATLLVEEDEDEGEGGGEGSEGMLGGTNGKKEGVEVLDCVFWRGEMTFSMFTKGEFML